MIFRINYTKSRDLRERCLHLEFPSVVFLARRIKQLQHRAWLREKRIVRQKEVKTRVSSSWQLHLSHHRFVVQPALYTVNLVTR